MEVGRRGAGNRAVDANMRNREPFKGGNHKTGQGNARPIRDVDNLRQRRRRGLLLDKTARERLDEGVTVR